MLRLGILISGRGSNFVAIADAIAAGRLDAEIAVVLSNRADAGGIASARERGMKAVVVASKGTTREEHEAQLARVLAENRVELVVLAGYMRLLGTKLIEEYAGRIVNIHPSLLPAFPGLNAQGQALAYGVKVTGCTVHFVTAGLDEGPIILQKAVAVREGDTEETLSARILEQEHVAYTEALQLVAEGRVRVDGRRVIIEWPCT